MKAFPLDYRGMMIHASRDAWFNATEVAEAHGKRLDQFWREETREYLKAMCEISKKVSQIDEKFGRRLPDTLKNPDFHPSAQIHGMGRGKQKLARHPKILTENPLADYRKNTSLTEQSTTSNSIAFSADNKGHKKWGIAPYIATVAVPVAPTAQDIAADLSPAYWHPLGQFPDEARAKAAVQAFIATHDHDAYFISADPAHPLYQRAIRRLGGAA